MKSIEQVLAELDRWLRSQDRWQRAVLGDTEGWPRKIKLGAPSGATLEEDFSRVLGWAHGWQDWAQSNEVELETAGRRLAGTAQRLPIYIHVPDADTALHLLGGTWPDLFRTAKDRASILTSHFPKADPLRILREIAGLTEIDFHVLIRAAEWFRGHDATGLTPRQVPIEGMDSKWLNHRQQLVRHLCGKETLGLIDRPRTVHYTYLDPLHLHGGGRRHDSITEGDRSAPHYIPERIIITENKDTALFFPELCHGIAVQGNGSTGPALIPEIEWVVGASSVVYWGDLDARGFEIVDQYRSRGLLVDTILMDIATLERHGRYGVRKDSGGNDIFRPRKALSNLTPGEQAAYDKVTDHQWDGPFRVEQERISLEAAHALVSQAKAQNLDRMA